MDREFNSWRRPSKSEVEITKSLLERKLLEGPDVFWEGDLILPTESILVMGDLIVTGHIVASSINVGGNFSAKSVTSS